MAGNIHPTAVIAPEAELGADVEVGAYAVIGAGVQVGDRTRIGPHVVIEGPTRLGADNHVFPYASVGSAPQDKKYRGEPTRLEIGDRNVIRECVTLNRGTVQDQGVTRIGNDNRFMAYAHVAHDCVIANNAAVTRDVPPYVMAVGQPAAAHSVNAEGLKRRGFTPEQIRNVRNAFRLLYRSGLKLADAQSQLAALAQEQPELRLLAEFLPQSTRSIVR